MLTVLTWAVLYRHWTLQKGLRMGPKMTIAEPQHTSSSAFMRFSIGKALLGLSVARMRRPQRGGEFDPIAGLEAIAAKSGGIPVRLNLGVMRPYLLLQPEHLEHAWGSGDVYRREGTLWKAIQRLEGYGIAGEGPRWKASRKILQPEFTVQHTRELTPMVAETVAEACERLVARAAGQPFDVITEMTRITHHVLIRLFFGNRISDLDAERLGTAISDAFAAIGWRTLLPMVPNAVPLPGDRTFNRAVRIADEVIYPLIDDSIRRQSDDLVSRFVVAKDEVGETFDRQRVRDDLVGIVIAGTETTALTLTWLWLLLAMHPDVLDRVSSEVTSVVGVDTTLAEHLPHLRYSRMTLQETLRLYPVGWMMPRTVAAADVIDGVALRPGDTVLLSPYLTHRLPSVWDDPERFDPERFDDVKRPRGYLPFGFGGHRCLGEHFATAEALLVIAELLRRYRPRIVEPEDVGPQALRPAAAASLRPKVRPKMVLVPR